MKWSKTADDYEIITKCILINAIGNELQTITLHKFYICIY